MNSAAVLFVVVAIAVVNSAPTFDGSNVAKIAECRAQAAKAYAAELLKLNKDNAESLKAAADPKQKTQLIKEQNENRLQQTKLRIAAIQADDCAKQFAGSAGAAVAAKTVPRFEAANAAKIAQCRVEETKAFVTESLTIQKQHAEALKAVTDPKQKTELIKEQSKERSVRTQARIAALKEDKCSQLSATTTAAPIVVSTDAVVTSTSAAVAPAAVSSDALVTETSESLQTIQ